MRTSKCSFISGKGDNDRCGGGSDRVRVSNNSVGGDIIDNE